MQSHTVALNEFPAQLHAETDIGSCTLPILMGQAIATWPQIFEEHPQWCRFGTFSALLNAAHAELVGNDAHRALAISLFVPSYADQLPSELRRYLAALEVCRQILMDQNEYELAKDVYRAASIAAQQLEDRR